MSQENPYNLQDGGLLAAADAPVEARVEFLRKTYTTLLTAILIFAATLWAAGEITPVKNLMISLVVNPWLTLAIYIGGAIAVHALAEKPGIGIVVFYAFAAVWGLISAPLILMVAENQPHVITQAALATAIIFTGLTAYVFKSGKDFAFLGGMLFTAMWGLFGLAILGLIFGFTMGTWVSYAGALVFSGFILYDTSNILHRYPTTAYVSAAMVLFVDVIILFKNLVMIFLDRD